MKAPTIVCLAGLLFSGAALAQHASHQAPQTKPPGIASRQADVAQRGAQVMPFDLDRSTHIFEPLPDGGMQTVVSKDDAFDQVELIRDHLTKEAAAFAEGNYGSPASIHGAEMPGLSDLTGSAGRVSVIYETIDGGGRIRFTSGEARLVEAIHRWFDAQVSDHGAHAVH